MATTEKKKKKRRKKEGAAEGPASVPSARPQAAEADETDERVSGGAVATLALSGRWKSVIAIVAFVYLGTVWMDGIGSNLPVGFTPRVWLYFSQIAALFKNAGIMAIDYRAEGWSCSDKKWIEVDVRPFFRIDADTKESRFHRALQFYRKERSVMRALEDYVIKSNNASSQRPAIGGVRFLSLRIPYPKVGSHVTKLELKPLAEYPEDMRHNWYWTPGTARRERCGDTTPAPPKEDDEAASTSPASSSSSADDKPTKRNKKRGPAKDPDPPKDPEEPPP